MPISRARSLRKAAKHLLRGLCVAGLIIAPAYLRADDWAEDLLMVDPSPQAWEIDTRLHPQPLAAKADDEAMELVDGEQAADGPNLSAVLAGLQNDTVPPAPPAEEGDGAQPAQQNPNAQAPTKPLGQAPADKDNRLLVLRRSTVLLEPGQCAIDYGVEYRWEDFRTPAIANIPPGFPFPAGPSLVNNRVRSRQLFVPLALRYGLAEDTQLFTNLPFGFWNLERSNPGVDDNSSVFGTGDFSAGFNQTLCHEAVDTPELVGTVSFSAPLGADPFELSPGPAALGSGFWSITGSLLAIKSYDPAVVFAGIGYSHQFDRDYLGGTFDPGEVFTYQFGTAFGINDSVTLNAVFLGQIQSETQYNNLSLPGSMNEPLQLRFSVICSKSECLIIEPFATIGMTPDAPQADIGVIFTERF